MAEIASAHGNVHVEALLNEGKGEFFCGPYPIHNTVPALMAKQLKAFFYELQQAARRITPHQDPGNAPYHSYSPDSLASAFNSLRQVHRSHLLRHLPWGLGLQR